MSSRHFLVPWHHRAPRVTEASLVEEREDRKNAGLRFDSAAHHSALSLIRRPLFQFEFFSRTMPKRSGLVVRVPWISRHESLTSTKITTTEAAK